MVWCYDYKRQYTDKTLTLRKCMCMRANGASELRKFRYFYILKPLFLSIFCRYIRYFVGTKWYACRLTCTNKFSNVPTNFQMYRQKSEKALWGGGGAGGQLPPPPSGYANDRYSYLHARIDQTWNHKILQTYRQRCWRMHYQSSPSPLPAPPVSICPGLDIEHQSVTSSKIKISIFMIFFIFR